MSGSKVGFSLLSFWMVDLNPLVLFPGYDLGKVDKYIHNLGQKSHGQHCAEFCERHITRPFSNQVQRLRAIYRWILGNIQYDQTRRIWTPDDGTEDETVEAVFSKRVCGRHGFAYLFEAMCRAIGVPCLVSFGYLKGRAGLGTVQVEHLG
jgi:transglutaminase/protease-like cytokinesis protein 3